MRCTPLPKFRHVGRVTGKRRPWCSLKQVKRNAQASQRVILSPLPTTSDVFRDCNIRSPIHSDRILPLGRAYYSKNQRISHRVSTLLKPNKQRTRHTLPPFTPVPMSKGGRQEKKITQTTHKVSRASSSLHLPPHPLFTCHPPHLSPPPSFSPHPPQFIILTTSPQPASPP